MSGGGGRSPLRRSSTQISSPQTKRFDRFGSFARKESFQCAESKETPASPSADSPTARKPEKEKVLYVNNINLQRYHDCYRVLLGADDTDFSHEDLYCPNPASGPRKHARFVLPDVDLEGLIRCATSFDAQFVHLGAQHVAFTKPLALTHVNVPNNYLCEEGFVRLVEALAQGGGARVMHLNVAQNQFGCGALERGASALAALPRLSSANFAGNLIRDHGSGVLARLVDTNARPVLSIDLSENYLTEEGGLVWAEVLTRHVSLQFLNFADNEMAVWSDRALKALCHASLRARQLTVLDFRRNFNQRIRHPASIPKGQRGYDQNFCTMDSLKGAITKNDFVDTTELAPSIGRSKEAVKQFFDEICRELPMYDTPEFRGGVIIQDPQRKRTVGPGSPQSRTTPQSSFLRSTTN